MADPGLSELPKVSRGRWRQELTGCVSVLGIIIAEVALVHANGWADADGAFTQMHQSLMLAVDVLAALALLLLAGVMCGGRDSVVRRTRETIHPLPQAVRHGRKQR